MNDVLPHSAEAQSVADDSLLEAWEKLESGKLHWSDFSLADKEKITRHYAPKIRFLALRLKTKLPRNVELSELISAGTLGLLEALGKFQPQLGIRFETYAENRIRGAMLDELRRLDWFPRSLRQRVRKLDEAMWQIEHEKGRPPTVEEIQERTGSAGQEKCIRAWKRCRVSSAFLWIPSRILLREKRKGAESPSKIRRIPKWWSGSPRLSTH